MNTNAKLKILQLGSADQKFLCQNVCLSTLHIVSICEHEFWNILSDFYLLFGILKKLQCVCVCVCVCVLQCQPTALLCPSGSTQGG